MNSIIITAQLQKHSEEDFLHQFCFGSVSAPSEQELVLINLLSWLLYLHVLRFLSAQPTNVEIKPDENTENYETCIVPIVLSNVSFKSPFVFESQAVHRAVNKSPVPTKAAGNLGI